MARELLTQVVQDPSRGFTRRPDLTVRHPDLVLALDAHADDHIRARMYGPAAPPSATEHALKLNVKPAAVIAAAAHLRALWKRELVDFQPVDGRGIPVGGRPYFPYATCPDLTAEPREELRGILEELARQGSHLLYGELLGDGGQGTRRFGEILTGALSREEPLRIRVDSDLVLPWPMLALPEDTASGPGGPVGDAFRRFLGYRHQIEQTGGHHPSLPALPDLLDPADNEHARLPPPLPVVSLNHDQGIDPEGATRAAEVESALATGTVRVERTRCDELLGALRSGGLDEQLMYFWCHGHFRPVPDDSAPLFAVRLSDHKDIDVRTVLTERGVAEPRSRDVPWCSSTPVTPGCPPTPSRHAWAARSSRRARAGCWGPRSRCHGCSPPSTPTRTSPAISAGGRPRARSSTGSPDTSPTCGATRSASRTPCSAAWTAGWSGPP